MRRWAWIAILLLLALFVVAARLLVFRPRSPSSQPTGIANKIYISQVSSTVLQFLSVDKAASQPSKGDLLDFKSGEFFSTAETGNGYVQLGFPGQAAVYMASGTEMLLKDPADERVGIDIVLTRGLLLVRLPNAFPANQRLAVESPDGAQVWVSGSTMGVQYDPSTHELYADCLQGQCGYADAGGSQSLSEGSHISLNGTTVLSSGPGPRSELWQFVPDIVEAPTPIPSATPNLAATQSCRYFTSLGLSCDSGFPTATITASPTPNLAATQACRRSLNLGTPCP